MIGSMETGVRWRITVIVALLTSISLFHYFSPPHWHLLHTVMGHAYLVPIIVSSYWFALKGGVICSLAAGLLFSPHIPFQFKEVEAEKFIELFVYAVIGVITGVLSGKLQKRTEEIVEAEERLHAADRLSSVGELAAGVAHEIRNPLGAIQGAVEILGEDFPEGHPKRQFFTIITGEVSRLNRIVEEFLGLARPKSFQGAQVDLVDIIRSVVFLMSFKARKRRVDLEVHLPSSLSLIADADSLKQMLLNIFLNALESIPPVGGMIRVTAGINADQVLIDIEDTGKGISPEELSKLFDPFYSTKKGGTGLGLSISRRIAQNHGGVIEAESQPGRGTVIHIRLPGGASSGRAAEGERGSSRV